MKRVLKDLQNAREEARKRMDVENKEEEYGEGEGEHWERMKSMPIQSLSERVLKLRRECDDVKIENERLGYDICKLRSSRLTPSSNSFPPPSSDKRYGDVVSSLNLLHSTLLPALMHSENQAREYKRDIFHLKAQDLFKSYGIVAGGDGEGDVGARGIMGMSWTCDTGRYYDSSPSFESFPSSPDEYVDVERRVGEIYARGRVGWMRNTNAVLYSVVRMIKQLDKLECLYDQSGSSTPSSSEGGYYGNEILRNDRGGKEGEGRGWDYLGWRKEGGGGGGRKERKTKRGVVIVDGAGGIGGVQDGYGTTHVLDIWGAGEEGGIARRIVEGGEESGLGRGIVTSGDRNDGGKGFIRHVTTEGRMSRVEEEHGKDIGVDPFSETKAESTTMNYKRRISDVGMGLMRKGMEIVQKVSSNTSAANTTPPLDVGSGESYLQNASSSNPPHSNANSNPPQSQPSTPLASSIALARTYVVPQSFRLAFEVLITVIIAKCEKHGVDLQGVQGRDLLGMLKRMENRFGMG